MVIFLNGSINAGKTTVGKILAKKLGAEFVEFDDISKAMPNFDLAKDIPKVIETGIKKTNELIQNGKDVVIAYPLRKTDYKKLEKNLITKPNYITLALRLEKVIRNRGTRQLSDWERSRVKYHYKTKIHNPDFGITINNSDISPEETAEKIIEALNIKLL